MSITSLVAQIIPTYMYNMHTQYADMHLHNIPCSYINKMPPFNTFYLRAVETGTGPAVLIVWLIYKDNN